MSIVMVTGCCGMIGSHVVDRLIENGHKVWGVDDMSGGMRTNLPPDFDLVQMNCIEAKCLEFVNGADPVDFVIHCAAFAAENLSHNARVFTIQNNLVGEAVMRNFCIRHNVKCMVSLSSIAVMGHQRPPFDDDTPPMPADPYGVTKFAGELDARAAHAFHGLNYCVMRPHNVIGIRQNYADRFRNVAAIFIRQAFEGKPLTIFGDGFQTRAFSPVSYVSKVIAATIDSPECWNHVFNVGAEFPVSVDQLARTICALVGVKPNIVHLPARQEAEEAWMTHEKCRRFFPEIPIPPAEALVETLSGMVEEMRGKTFPPMQKGPTIELKEGLPESWKS